MDLGWVKYLFSSDARLDADLKRLREEKATVDAERIKKLQEENLKQAHINGMQLYESDIKHLSLLHPIVKDKAIIFLTKARQQGLKVGIFSSYRTLQEQLDLYNKGRDDEGNIINPKEIVTMAKYGWHNFAIAIDIVMDSSDRVGLQPSWEAFVDANKDKINDWHQLGKIGMDLGFIWGGTWKEPVDAPHFEYHEGIITREDAFALYKKGGLDEVWAKIV